MLFTRKMLDEPVVGLQVVAEGTFPVELLGRKRRRVPVTATVDPDTGEVTLTVPVSRIKDLR